MGDPADWLLTTEERGNPATSIPAWTEGNLVEPLVHGASYFERLVASCGVGDAVRFLGFVPDDELPALYNAVDLYVGVSRRFDLMAEGFGIALVEASASGLPVVGGRSGGVPDAVRDGETGLLVDPDDPGAVAHAITRLLGDAELRRRMGAAGRRAVETYYNWDRVARDLRRIDAEFRRPHHDPSSFDG